MIADYPLIPYQAFLYFPKNEQLICKSNAKVQRIIFDGEVQYQEWENVKILEFENFLIKNNQFKQFTNHYSNAIKLRFLYASNFDLKDAGKCLQKYYAWQQNNTPLKLTSQIQTSLQSGIIYMSGRDCSFRPIFIINVGKILKNNIKENDLLKTLGYFFQFAIQNLLIEGQVQTWNCIIDLGNASVFSLGGALVNVITFLSNNFKCRVNHSFLVNCPASIKWVWGMVKSALTQSQLKKISMTDKTTIPIESQSYINFEQVQVKYGGKKSNVTNYWPIDVENIYCDKTHFTHQRLISKQDYNQLFQNGLLGNKKIKKCLIRAYCGLHETLSSNCSFFSLKHKNGVQSSLLVKNTQEYIFEKIAQICQCHEIPIEQEIPQIPIFAPPLNFKFQKIRF